MEQAEAAENSSGFNPSPVCFSFLSVQQPQHDAHTESSSLILIKCNNGMMEWILQKITRERKPCTARKHTQRITQTHTVRGDTHHPHVSALSSCIPACGGRPRACDCVRGGVWMANSIWTEDSIQRCQYSPHCPSSLIMQGEGREANVEQNVNIENATNRRLQEVTKKSGATYMEKIKDHFEILKAQRR